MKPILCLSLLFTISCSGLQSTKADCEEGFTLADDGACYPSTNGARFDDGDDGAPLDSGSPDVTGGGEAGGGEVGGGEVGGGDVGGGDVGGGDVGGGDVGGGDVGGGEAGGGAVGGEAGGGETGEDEFTPKECSSDGDCGEGDCPAGGTGCGCNTEIGECMPTCSVDADCDSDMVCFAGFCEPPIES